MPSCLHLGHHSIGCSIIDIIDDSYVPTVQCVFTCSIFLVLFLLDYVSFLKGAIANRLQTYFDS